MSLGRNFVPCERTNGRIMMKIQVDPVVLNFEDLVEDTVVHLWSLDDAMEFSQLTKKEVIEVLKRNAEYAAYNGYGSKESEVLGSWYDLNVEGYNLCIDLVAKKLKLVFPQWKDEDMTRIEKLKEKEEEEEELPPCPVFGKVF
jgi:hypothetical protein